MTQVWLLIERHEDEGTDWYNVVAVYDNEVDAKSAERVMEDQHGNQDGEWCECCRMDWRVEGPWDVNRGQRKVDQCDRPGCLLVIAHAGECVFTRAGVAREAKKGRRLA